MSARAILVKQFGPPEDLVFETVADRPLGALEVRLRVRACGVNFPDRLIAAGLYQFKPELPFSPGSEAAGEIMEIGAGVQNLSLGDRVVWFGLHGAFREHLVVAADELMAIPAAMTMEDAAAFIMAYATSIHALQDRARIARGETLLVFGAGGGVGLAAVALGKLLGARVIAAASSEEKLQAARDHGADATINYAEEDFRARVRELSAGRGVDVLYDPVGGAIAELGLRAMAIDGRYLVVGFASGEIPKFPANLALLKECQIVGVFYGAFMKREPTAAARNIEQLFSWYQEGLIRPRIHGTLPLKDAAKALNQLGERRIVGKLVLLA